MFLLSILAYLHPCNDNHPNRVSILRHYLNELKIQGFDFTNGFKCSDVHKFNELNNLPINLLELTFYQDQKNWRHKLVPIEVSKNESHRVIDLLIYKNHNALNKKVNVCLGDHQKTFICRRCMISYTSENMLKLQKQKCEKNDINTFRTSPESHLYWKRHFHKNSLYFRMCADFEADNEKDNTDIGKKTLIFINKNRYLMVMKWHLNWKMFQKVVIFNPLLDMIMQIGLWTKL